MMKVLFVTLYPLEVNTSVTQSNIGIIKGLISLGIDLTILMPSHVNSAKSISWLNGEERVKILRIKNDNLGTKIAYNAKYAKGIKLRVISYLRNLYKKITIFDRTKAFLKEANRISGIERHYDAIISTSDPKTSHLFVKKMLKKGKVTCDKWIQHWGDPLASDISSKKIYPMSILKFVEKSIIKHADKVVYVSPFTCDEQKNKYVKHASKMVFVPLACVLNDDAKYKHCILDNNEKKFTACYLGAYFSHIRDITPLYQAFKEMPDVNLIIAGSSDVELTPTENIRILPQISQEEANMIEIKSDMIISVGNKRGTQIPGKLYYSCGLNKPILVTVDGENKSKMKCYFESFNRFCVCINNKQEIIATVKSALKYRVDYSLPDQLTPNNVAKNILY